MRRLLFGVSVLIGLASLLGLAASLHQRGVQTFGAVQGLPDPALDPRPASLRAVNIDLNLYNDADLSRVGEQIAGFGWVRQTFAWNQIHPSPGDAYVWSNTDRAVDTARRLGKPIIAVLSFGPALGREPLPIPLSAPPAPEHFAEFAAAFAARYRDRIDVYQVWDEPNLAGSWGDQLPSAAQYASLLQAAYVAIHAADPTATVLAAALAPTVETGPKNLSDLLYLQQLYDLGAGRYFDAAAGKPFGFYTGPDDRQTDPNLLNFSRFALLRQVMERNGDGHKLLWGGNFGWNTLASPWGTATAEQQRDYTLRAYERAEQEWPWAGPLALENYQPAAPADDARWGFALADPAHDLTPLGQALLSLPGPQAAPPGNYTASHPSAHYTGAWGFSELGADIPEDDAGARIEIRFQGSDFALRVRRGDYRAYLYVAVDGQPANRLPRDSAGRGAYLVLTSPDLMPEVAVIPVASSLDPNQVHTAVIKPDRGWDQWAMVGFSVGRRTPPGGFDLAAGLLLALAGVGLGGMLYHGRSLTWGAAGTTLHAAWTRLGDIGQLTLTALVAAGLYFTAWLTWENEITAFTRRFGDATPLLLTAATAGLFYFSPSFLVAILALIALFVLFYLRLDIALAFLALFIPFYLFPRMLWERGASLLEFSLWLALGAWCLRNFRPLLSQAKARLRRTGQALTESHSSGWAAWLRLSGPWSGIDFGVLGLLIVSAASLATSARLDVAVYEFRTILLGSSLFYFLLRATPLEDRALWRIVDFFILGAVAVAVIGLQQYVTGAGLIVTEEGVARIRSVYGSPNNLSLYLGRALPVAVAVAVMGKTSQRAPASISRLFTRRPLYALAALIMAAALVLTFSRGALVLGVPAALAVILIGWQGRRGAVTVGAAAALALAGLPLLAQLPRFATLFDLQSGTGFFRINLWISAWRMFLDHPLLGVGLDNFLYAYRGFYILPEAWQEPNLSHPHNLVLDFLSRLGLLGLACGAWLLVSFWRQALRSLRQLPAGSGERALAVGLMALVADMLAHGVVDHSFFLVDLAFVFYLALALSQRLRPQAL